MLLKREDGVIENLNRFTAIRVRQGKGICRWELVGQLSEPSEDEFAHGPCALLFTFETESAANKMLDEILNHFNGFTPPAEIPFIFV